VLTGEKSTTCTHHPSELHPCLSVFIRGSKFPRSHYAAISGNTWQYADEGQIPCRVLPPNSSPIAAYPIFLPRKITRAGRPNWEGWHVAVPNLALRLI
jgi:hypothetical protein